MQLSERPRFLILRQESGLTSEQVAQEARLPLADEYRAEIGCVVERHVAENILAAFSLLTGKKWDMQAVFINTHRREE